MTRIQEAKTLLKKNQDFLQNLETNSIEYQMTENTISDLKAIIKFEELFE